MPADAARIAPHLRQDDLDEMQVLCPGDDPVALIADGILRGDWAWTVEVNGEIAVIFGVGAVTGGVGIPWMVGTDAVDKNARLLLEESPQVLRSMLSEYDELCNVVSADHHKAIRWLRWLGFSFTPVVAPSGAAAYLFRLTSPCAPSPQSSA